MITADLIGALRAVVNDKVKTHQPWRVIEPVVDTLIRRAGAGHRIDDARQTVCLKLFKTTSTVNADSNGGAYRFLEKVVSGVCRDLHRRDKARPRAADYRNDDDPYAHIAAPPADDGLGLDDQQALLEDLIDRVRAEIDDLIAESGKNAEQRLSASRHAEATLMARIHRMESKHIAAELGVADTTNDTIAKWVERGRTWVLDAIDAVATDAPDDEGKALSNLRELVAKRRKDAGVARLDRRQAPAPKAATKPPASGSRGGKKERQR